MFNKTNQLHFLDQNFEQALIDLGYDDVLDNSVLTSNINTVKILELAGIYFADLKWN